MAGPLLTPDAVQDNPATDYKLQTLRAAERHGIDPVSFLRQINQESSFNPEAVSPAGAMGIAQFMPETARSYGVDPTDPISSLDGAARYMRDNLDRFGGDQRAATAAYNAGEGTISDLQQQHGGDWESYLPGETQSYLDAIFGNHTAARNDPGLNNAPPLPAPGPPGAIMNGAPAPQAAAAPPKLQGFAGAFGSVVPPIPDAYVGSPLQQHLSQGTQAPLDVTNPTDYTTLQEQVERATAAPQEGMIYDPNVAQERANAVLGPSDAGLSVPGAIAGAFNAVNPSIPVVTPAINKYVKPLVGGMINSAPGVNVINAVSQAVGGPNIGRTIADATVPARSAELALAALPEISRLAGGSETVLNAAEDLGRAIRGESRVYRGAGEAGTILDETGNVVQGGRAGAAGPTGDPGAEVGRPRRPGMSFQPVGGGAPEPAEEAAQAAGRALPAPTPAEAELNVVRDFIATALEGGSVPAREPYAATRDEEFAAAINAVGNGAETQSALHPGIESAQEAIVNGQKLGYSDADIAAYLKRNYLPTQGSSLTGAATPPASATATGEDVPLIPAGRGNGEPPSTPEEPPVNFDDVRGKFLKAAQEERNARATGAVNRQIREGRAAQAGGIAGAAQATSGGTFAEAGAAARAAAYQGGTLRKTFLKPIELSPAEERATVAELSRKVDAGEMTPFEFLRMVAPAESASPGVIAKLTSNAPKLQPNEVRLIRKLFGDEVANVARDRSDLSLEPTMTALQEQRLMESIRTTEAKIVAKTQADSVKAEQANNLRAAKAQETKDARDINAANRQKQSMIDAQMRAEKAELDANNRYLAQVDAANERARQAEIRQGQRETVQRGREQESLDQLRTRIAAEAANEEMRGNLRALDAMTKVQYTNPLHQEHLDNMRALNAMWEKSYDGIYRKAEDAATAAGSPNAAEIIRYQLAGNRAILDRLTSPDGLARIGHLVRSAATGDLADSYLTALQRRTETLRSAFVADGMDPEIAHDVATTFRDAELRARYGSTTMPPRVKALLDEMKAPAFGDSWGALDKLIQRWKNTVFSTDFGVVGTQLKASIDRGGVSGIAGYINRTLSFLNLPHADLYEAEVNLPKQIRNIMDGLYVGAAPSATMPAQGTLFSYITPYLGKPGEVFDKSVEWLMDKGNAIQFKTILGHARDVSYEGNLAILKLLGRDIASPRVRLTAANYANATSLFAQTALNSTRAGWERRLFTSVPMLRSEVANILQMAKFFNPTASAEERILASTSILSRLVSVLLVGKLINDQLGVSGYVMDPFASGFGQITTRLKDKAGRNVVISMFPQESLVKAFGKAVLALKDADPATAGRDLLQGISGRLSLPGNLIENVAGYGYDVEGKFHTGDLHLGIGGLIQKTFAPPLASQFLQDPSSAYLGAQTFGVSAFPEGTSGLKDRNAQQTFGKGYQDLTPLQRAQIDKLPDVASSKAASPTQYQTTSDTAHQPIKEEVQRQETLFQQGKNTKALRDVYHDEGVANRQAAHDLEGQFADQFAGFNKTQYDKAVEGYYNLADDPKNKIGTGLPDAGNIDFDKVASAQKDYLASLPADQRQWVTEALQVAEGKKTPLQQKYDTFIDAKKQAGYFNIQPDDPQAVQKRAALDKAHPDIDAQSWYFGNTVAKPGGSLNSIQGVDAALKLDPNRPVKLQGLERPINQDAGSLAVWQQNKTLIDRYMSIGQQLGEKAAAQIYPDKKYADLSPSEKGNVARQLHEEAMSDPRFGAQLNAVLVYEGVTSSFYTPEAEQAFRQIIQRYGSKPPGAKPYSFREAF